MQTINNSPQKLKILYFFAEITVAKQLEEHFDKELLYKEFKFFKFSFGFDKFTLTVSFNQKCIKFQKLKFSFLVGSMITSR